VRGRVELGAYLHKRGGHAERPSPPHAWPLDMWPSCPLHEFRGQIDHHPAEPPGRDYYAHHNPAYFGPGGDVLEFYYKEKPILMKLAYLVGLITFLGHFFGMPAPSLVLSQLTRCRDYRRRPSRLRLVLVLNNIAVLPAFSWVMLVGQFEISPQLCLC